MTTESILKTVTIFEGCNGSGKTDAAKKYAEKHDALYIHFNALLGLENLNRVYLGALTPVQYNHCNVVLDRSWLSEYPYSNVFRDGSIRFDNIDRLEHWAFASQALVVYCKPEIDKLIEFYFKERNRPGMISSENDLRRLYELYDVSIIERNTIPFVLYDRFESPDFISFIEDYEYARRFK